MQVVLGGRLPRPRSRRGHDQDALPDAHTDFIFAVVAEEYGVMACLVLLGLFAFVVLRALIAAARAGRGDAACHPGAGLLFGLQALINMGVNVGLCRPKA